MGQKKIMNVRLVRENDKDQENTVGKLPLLVLLFKFSMSFDY